MQVLVRQHVDERARRRAGRPRPRRARRPAAHRGFRTPAGNTGPPRCRCAGRFSSHTAPSRGARPQQPQRLRAALELAGLHRVVLGRAFAPRDAQFAAPGTAGSSACAPGRRWRPDPSGPACSAAWLRRIARRGSSACGLRPTSCARWRRLARSASKPSTRVSTRLTLPSRMATRSPKQNEAIAAAVERPMPGSVCSACALRGKLAAVQRHHLLGAAVQVARPAVVAQAAPQGQHLVQWRGGQRRHIRKAREEARVVAAAPSPPASAAA